MAHKDGGHNKFLESMAVWLDIKAPRYWWQEWDTYRVGMTKQSESTVHTGLRDPLGFYMFSKLTDNRMILLIEEIRKGCAETGDIARLKANLPEGFLQRRLITTNYKTILHIVRQRHAHRLSEWQDFCEAMRGLQYGHFIFGGEE